MDELLLKKIARTIDHTNLKPNAGEDDIKNLCVEAAENDFASVCVLPYFVAQAADILRGSCVEICTVVGFPLGASNTDAKIVETEIALADGASEIDMVIYLPALFAGKCDLVRDDIRSIVEVSHASGAIVKVIFETFLLDENQKLAACKSAVHGGADFVKTSTGFAGGGATIEDVDFMRKHCPISVKIKASGGVKTAEFALRLIEAGADRIGTSSGIKIIEEAKNL